jgi:hypothetical protein
VHSVGIVVAIPNDGMAATDSGTVGTQGGNAGVGYLDPLALSLRNPADMRSLGVALN